MKSCRCCKKIKRSVKSRSKKELKRLGKQVAIGYLATVLPLGYATTSITTQSDSPFSKLLSGGVINVMTGGLSTPIYELLTSTVGKGQELVGNWFDSEELIKKGQDRIAQSKNWFKDETSNSDDVVTSKFDDSNLSEIEKINYYQVIGESGLEEQDFSKSSRYDYSEFDYLGRTGVAKATITIEAINKARGHEVKFSKKDNPTGYPSGGSKHKNPKVKLYRDGDEYLFNRSHLIADQLGGEASRRNVVTGTRTQNVGVDHKGGMRYSEQKVYDYIKHNPDVVVYYQVKPIYKNEELIPRTVIVKMLSSDGGIDEQVVVYNTAKDIKIDYKNGY